MKLLVFIFLIIFSNNSFAQSLANLRAEAFHKSAFCNIINAKEVLTLSTTPFTETRLPEIRTLIIDTKTIRNNCYDKAQEIIDNLLINEQTSVNKNNSSVITQLQYEADLSFKALLKLRKQTSNELLESILTDIEKMFILPSLKAKFYTESNITKHLIQLETSLAIESERRQIFVTNNVFSPTKKQLINSILQKSHYQFTKTLLLFEKWSSTQNKKVFFKEFNSELRYAVSTFSQLLNYKQSLPAKKYKQLRDTLQKAVRLNIKMTNKENQTNAKSSEIYSEISSFNQTIRLLLSN